MKEKVAVEVEGIGFLRSWYLSSKQLSNIGKECKCLSCGNVFQAGVAELNRAKLDYKFRPVRTVEVFDLVDADHADWKSFVKSCNELPEDVNDWYVVKDIAVKPEFHSLSLSDQAVVFGVQGFNVKVCSDCSVKHQEVSEGVVHQVHMPE